MIIKQLHYKSRSHFWTDNVVYTQVFIYKVRIYILIHSPQSLNINLDALSVDPLIFQGAQLFTPSPFGSHSTFPPPISVQPEGKKALARTVRDTYLSPTSISAQRIEKQEEVWHSADGVLEWKRRKHFSIIFITPSPQGTLWVSLWS